MTITNTPLTAQQKVEQTERLVDQWMGKLDVYQGEVTLDRLTPLLLRLAEELEALKSQIPQWQPIETADKRSASLVLLARGSTVTVGYWSPVSRRWDAGLMTQMLREPTHWMPLPAAPREEPKP